MRNIAGIAQTDAQKSSDMFMKCQYLDELTGGKGVTFATGTQCPIVWLNSTPSCGIYNMIQSRKWASDILIPGRRLLGRRLRRLNFAGRDGLSCENTVCPVFNLPELISLFKESADIQTADMLNLPVPEAEYINEVLKPSEIQQDMSVHLPTGQRRLEAVGRANSG